MASLNIDIDIKALNVRSGVQRQARINSDVPNALRTKYDPGLAKLVPANKANYPEYYENWDADLRSYKYLNDFFVTNPNWLPDLVAAAEVNQHKPPQRLDPADLNTEVKAILEMVKERDSRFMEIVDQDDGEGALSYWFGLLNIDPAHHPYTNLMVRVGRRIGEHVVMCLKEHFKSPRPPQLCPAIMPMIDPPMTPSFPAGHALQSNLISYLLAYSLPNMLQQKPLPNPDDGGKYEDAEGLLFDLAERVGRNRIVAGIHFPTDIEAGKTVAIECFKLLQNVESIWKSPDEVNAPCLRERVRREFKQYA